MEKIKKNRLRLMLRKIKEQRAGIKVQRRLYFMLCFLFSAYCLLPTAYCYGGFTDRVVAFVDDEAITMSEFEQQYENSLKLSPDISKEDVIETMINRRLLLREAKKYRIEATSEEEIMEEYINLKVRAFIKVSDTDTEDFYEQNINQFSGKNYDDVREEIERYLIEKEVNERLKEALGELREKAYIKIQLNAE